MTDIAIVKLRHQIMKDRGMVPPKQGKVPATPVPNLDAYDLDVPLLPKMKYIEARFGVKVKTDIFCGSINDVCRRYRWEVDRSTISRWRKYMRRFLMEVIK